MIKRRSRRNRVSIRAMCASSNIRRIYFPDFFFAWNRSPETGVWLRKDSGGQGFHSVDRWVQPGAFFGRIYDVICCDSIFVNMMVIVLSNKEHPHIARKYSMVPRSHRLTLQQGGGGRVGSGLGRTSSTRCLRSLRDASVRSRLPAGSEPVAATHRNQRQRFAPKGG